MAVTSYVTSYGPEITSETSRLDMNFLMTSNGSEYAVSDTNYTTTSTTDAAAISAVTNDSIGPSSLASFHAINVSIAGTATAFLNNQTTPSWLCDANNSDLWQLQNPICTTRFESVYVFLIVAFLFASIILWTVLGNILVLVALYKFKTLRTMSNCLIGNLAISDLLLTTTVLPVSSTNDLLGYWVFGEVACALWLCMDVLYCTASVWGLCTVAFDRYMATAYPVWYHDKRSVRKAIGCVVFVWIFSIVISFAPFIGWQHMIPSFFTFNHGLDRHECILFTSSSYVIYSSTGSFIIPTGLMTFMYIRIFRVLHQQSQNMKRKAQYRKAPRRRAVIANGCPTIKVQSTHDTDHVVRDFTTTTLVSMTAVESSFYSDDRDQDESSFEQEHLLVPRKSLHSPNGVTSDSSCVRDMNCPSDQCTNGTPKDNNDTLHNGDSTPENNSIILGSDKTAQNGTSLENASLLLSIPLAPERSRSPQKRSKSLCAMSSPDANANSTMEFLNIASIERRNSSENSKVSPKRRSYPDSSPMGESSSALGTLLKPVSHRSKSATVLTSSEDEGALHGLHTKKSHAPRPSLPSDLTKLGRRNNKMTLSMKRRFELREQRATKRMLLIMACFCVCWMPFVIMYITRSLCDACHMNTHLVAAIIWLGYVNSSLNPILYSLFNDDFKAAFKKLLGIRSPPPRAKR